jgi:hypothetical protein
MRPPAQRDSHVLRTSRGRACPHSILHEARARRHEEPPLTCPRDERAQAPAHRMQVAQAHRRAAKRIRATARERAQSRSELSGSLLGRARSGEQEGSPRDEQAAPAQKRTPWRSSSAAFAGCDHLGSHASFPIEVQQPPQKRRASRSSASVQNRGFEEQVEGYGKSGELDW